jgi:methyl-accepting chemotaxis protein
MSGQADEQAAAMEHPDARELGALQRALADGHMAHAEVHAVLEAQVNGAIKTVNTLVEAVEREANQGHLAAVDLAAFMSDVSSLVDADFARVQGAIENTHHGCIALEQHAQNLRDAVSSTRKMLAEQRRLEAIGDRAQNLGMRIRIVAMNTTIQASQGASGGSATIAVLAREITSLAGDVQKLGLELKEAVHTMSVHLDRDVVNGVTQEAAATVEIGSTLAGHVQALREAYGALRGFRENLWVKVTTAGKQVSQHACSTMAALQYQDIARQRLEQVAQVLSQLIASERVLTSALVGRAPLPPQWKPVQARQLSEGYVMHSQRRAHDGSGSDPDAIEGPAIELF